MKEWTIRSRIVFGFSILIAITLGLGLFAIHRFRELKEDADAVVRNWAPSGNALRVVQFDLGTAERLLLREVTAETPAEAQECDGKVEAQQAKINSELEQYRALVSSAQGETPYYDATLSAMKTYRDSVDQVQAEIHAGQMKKAEHLLKETTLGLYNRAEEALEKEVDFNTEGAARAGLASDEGASSGERLTAILLGAALLLSVALAYVIVRDINAVLGRLGYILANNSAQIATAAEQVSANSQSLADGASQQAAAIEESGASVEEISSMVRSNADGALRAQALSKETRLAAEGVEAASREMAEAMADIKKSSDDVAKIIRTIDEIAFQTNLLALNAAVEAARAGDAGAGFAVVAAEVRSLAHRSSDAAKETASRIEAAAHQSVRGVDVSGRVVQQISQISSKVREVDTLIASIADASTEQSEGLAQVSSAMGEMDQVTQRNTAGAEEAAAAAEELNQQAYELQGVVETLLSLVERRKEGEEMYADLTGGKKRGGRVSPSVALADRVWNKNGSTQNGTLQSEISPIPMPKPRKSLGAKPFSAA